MLTYVAGKLGLTVQDKNERINQSDYLQKSTNISFTDMMTSSLADLQCMSFTLPIEGGSERAKWLNEVADDFVGLKMNSTVQACLNTGDALVVPFWTGRNIQNELVDAEHFIITKRFGEEATGIVYLAAEHKVKQDVYSLFQAIDLEFHQDEEGNTHCINRYRLFLARNGEPYIADPGQINQAWADLNPDWYIPGVDRLLVGRMKSKTTDPSDPNPVKGVPLCIGAKKPIAELHYLYDQFHVEFELGEATVFADKTVFAPNKKLPRGRKRVIQTVSRGRGVDEKALLEHWQPELRFQAYADAIQEQYRLFENAVGVSEGVLSRIDSGATNYENVDNVRKSMRKTQSFIEKSRKASEQFLEDLVYAWDVLANYYNITPMGDYGINYNWSDEYINTFKDRMDALMMAESIGAADAADIRAYLFNEPPEIADQKVIEISSRNALDAFESPVLTPTEINEALARRDD